MVSEAFLVLTLLRDCFLDLLEGVRGLLEADFARARAADFTRELAFSLFFLFLFSTKSFSIFLSSFKPRSSLPFFLALVVRWIMTLDMSRCATMNSLSR